MRAANRGKNAAARTLQSAGIMLGKKVVGTVVLAIGILLGAREAHAQTPFGGAAPADDAAAPSEDEQKVAAVVERRWYGEQTILADSVSLSLFGVAAIADSGATSGSFVAAGAVSWTLAAPIVHFAHGHIGKGFGDLGLRLGSVGVGAAVGAVVGLALYEPPPPRSDGSLGGAIADAVVPAVEMEIAMYRGAAIGAGVGALTATIIDSAALAREDVEKPGARILPTAQATPSGFSAGVTGAF